MAGSPCTRGQRGGVVRRPEYALSPAHPGLREPGGHPAMMMAPSPCIELMADPTTAWMVWVQVRVIELEPGLRQEDQGQPGVQ